MNKYNVLNFVFAFVVLLTSAMFLLPPDDTWLGLSDFPSYYAAARLISRGHAADVYRMDKLQPEINRYWTMPSGRAVFAAEPPLFMPAYEPLAYFTPAGSVAFSLILSVAATAAALTILSAILELRMWGTITLMVLTAGSVTYWCTIRIGKPVCIMLLALCCVMLLLKRRRDIGAAGASLLCLMKWHEILPLLMFASGARKWAYVVSFASACGLLAVISLLTFGIEGWSNYLQLLVTLSKGPALIRYWDMPTFRGQLCLLNIDWKICNLVSSGAFAVAMTILIWLGMKFKNQNRWWYEGFAISSLISVTFNMHCHLYDVLLLTPALCILIKAAKDAGDRVMLMLSCLVVFMFSIPVFMSLRPVHFFFASGQLNPYFVVLLATTAYAVWFVMKAARVERQVVERVSQVELNQPRVWS
ncbi:MAG TPA: glycosyltransferase 87 family protein [Candidatus Obscuribacterales bacterium]